MSRNVAREAIVFPTAVDPSDPDAWNQSRSFCIYVRFQPSRGYVVERMRDERLSVKGRKWCSHVERRNRRFYYFPTYKAALEAALKAVDDVKVNGKTWQEWEDHFAKKKEVME